MHLPPTNTRETQAPPHSDHGVESWQVADIRQALREADQDMFAMQQEVVATFAKFGVRYGL